MNLNAAVIDQRLSQLSSELRTRALDELGVRDETRLRSVAFVFLCVKTLLALSDDDAFDAITDGGNDFGVDAIFVGEEQDNEFAITLFQAKYKANLEGTANFPEDGVEAAVRAVSWLFDPNTMVTVNKRLLPKLEEARSRIRDGYIPQVRVLLCNNGAKWTDVAAQHIKRLGATDQVSWEHVNHDRLISVMQATKPVNDTLRLIGKAIVEDFDFSRILVGKVAVGEIASLIERHGDRLLERNIRRYLGLNGNRVNEGIRSTLSQLEERPNFYFYNNGITLTCSKFDYNALQQSDFLVQIQDLQIINGGQTSNTIARVMRELGALDADGLDKAFVLVRLYQLPVGRESFIQNITYATNSQNPVDLKDLHANDKVQLRLELDVDQLGYSYRRKRVDGSTSPEEITTGTAAVAILSVWRRRPHQAKFFAREHFGRLYHEIFSDDLTGAELIVATLLYRFAENKRKRLDKNAPDFLVYASCFLAMRMGDYLVRDLGLAKGEHVDHRSFERARTLIIDKAVAYAASAQSDLGDALEKLYGTSQLSLQRLAATFRRGDLIEELDHLPLRELA